MVVLRERGGDVEHRLTLPVPIYRGVYKASETYEVGDMVTYQGSLWHCNKAGAGIPGTGADWTLAAKRGRDAK